MIDRQPAVPPAPDWLTESAWTGTRAPLTRSTGLNPAAYTDSSFHRDEQRRLFERAWVCVGIAADVAAPGRLIVRQVGARSIIITRDGDGILRGFLNSCRHRGTELAESDCAVANTIRCPYHRWGYRLDGSLVATPFFDEVPRDDFDRADHGLIPVRVETWGVLLFACLDEHTPPLLTWLGDLPQRMAGYGLERWQKREEQTVRIKANWKLVTENFQEYYHLRWVHPELSKVSRVEDHYRYQGSGMYCGQTTTPVSGDDRDDWLALPPKQGLDRSDICSGRFLAVFPNVLLSVLPNHVFVMRLDPTAPGLTTETCTFLLPEESIDADEVAFGATRKFWLEVNAEDIDIVERGQRGLTAGAVPAGPLAPRFEEPLHRFHNMVADCFTLDDMADLVVRPGDRPDGRDRHGSGVNPSPPAVEVQ
ncbi:MAG: aromatic ring-hydroxylating oxygenase subunit alpha [Acidimicrobiales bacterium]